MSDDRPSAGGEPARTFKTLARALRHEVAKTKGSRHIATVAPVASADAAERVIASVRAELSDADHHAYAWRLRPEHGPPGAAFRTSDDGEPSGSAGKPILAQIDGRDLLDVVVVVSRYFGGTKLGVGGLVRAYGGAAAAGLDEAGIREVVPQTELTIAHAYEDSGAVAGVLAAFGAAARDPVYGEGVRFTLVVPAHEAEAVKAALRDATAARARVEERAGTE